MQFYAMITVDLHSASSEQREIFYHVLKKNGFTKIEDLSTTWSFTSPVVFVEDQFKQKIQTVLESAKRESKIKERAVYAVLVGNERLESGTF
jgi:hypothetical protein